MKTTLTRKEFLRLALVAGGGALLSACGIAAQPTAAAPEPLIVTSTPKPEPSATPLPPESTPTAAPATPTPAVPTASARTLPFPEVIRFYPQAPSRVVQAHLPGVWQGDRLEPDALGRMLDHSITALTGLNDSGEAWKALFAPGERVAIKVNTISTSIFWTHPPLVDAVTQRLVGAGLKPENILIFDRDADELEGAGYRLNRDGEGVRCDATGYRYNHFEKIGDYPVGISDLVYEVDALINMPVLKTHSMAGITFALKNHYGTFNSPQTFHSPQLLTEAIPGLNAIPAIRDRTRLVIGDALTACLRESPSYPYWNTAQTGDSIFMSFDSVALDTVALRHWSGLLEADGGDPRSAQAKAGLWLARGAELGLGANDFSQIELLEETLT